MQYNINDVVNGPEASRLGQALQALNDEAKTRIYNTLKQEGNDRILTGAWLLDMPGDISAVETQWCGCMIMDGAIHDKKFLNADDVLDVRNELETNEDSLIIRLFKWYGYDADEYVSYYEAYEDDDPGREITNHVLNHAAAAFDEFTQAFEDDFIDVWYYRSSNKTHPVGTLTEDGRKAVLAVFHKYVSVPSVS